MMDAAAESSTGLVFDCPHCHQGIEADPDFGGKPAKCPHCGKTITVPAQVGVAKPPSTLPRAPTTASPVHPAAAKAGTSKPVNGTAIAGLIIGILALVIPCLGFIGGIVGVICSASAMSQIRRNPAQGGQGLAVAGLTTSIVALCLSLVVAVLFFFGTASFAVVTAPLVEMLKQMSPPK